MRREFQLPEQDMAYLEALDLPWEAVRDGRLGRVVIHDFPLPEGYVNRTVSASLIIEPGYPDTQIDMAYFYPAIQRADGRSIPATTANSFDGKQWQCWSRHRTNKNPWRPGVDDLSTHVQLVRNWLVIELQKR